MCSNQRTAAEQARQLERVIDELAGAAQDPAAEDTPAAAELAELLARAWAMIASADPAVADKASRYNTY